MVYDTSNIIYGGDLILFMGSGTAKLPVAFSTSAKLSISMSTKDVTSKDSGYNTDKIAGRLDWNMSTDGLLSYALAVDDALQTSIDELYVLMLARKSINIVFATKSGASPDWTVSAVAVAGKKSFTGKGFITSIEQNADNDSATYSITIEGTGALTLA